MRFGFSSEGHFLLRAFNTLSKCRHHKGIPRGELESWPHVTSLVWVPRPLPDLPLFPALTCGPPGYPKRGSTPRILHCPPPRPHHIPHAAVPSHLLHPPNI